MVNLPGLWVVNGRSIIGSMGLIESASERYPTGRDVERASVEPNRSLIYLSISCAWRMEARYFLHSSSSSKEFTWVPNEAMACPIGVSQNGALGPKSGRAVSSTHPSMGEWNKESP